MKPDPEPLTEEECLRRVHDGIGYATTEEYEQMDSAITDNAHAVAHLHAEVERLRSLTPDIVNEQDEKIIPELERKCARLQSMLDGETALDYRGAVDDANATIAALEAERDEMQGIIATTADRLNTALRESGVSEIAGNPYHSFAVRDGVVALYDRGARWRAEADRIEGIGLDMEGQLHAARAADALLREAEGEMKAHRDACSVPANGPLLHAIAAHLEGAPPPE